MIINWTGNNYYMQQTSVIAWTYGTTIGGDIFGPTMVFSAYGR